MSARGAPRLYVTERLGAGAALELAAGQAHHLRTVLRLGPGATVAAFNASDGEWLCRIAEIGSNSALLTVERCLRPAEAEPDLWLVFAPIKRARLDWLVEKATELGVAALCRCGPRAPRPSASTSTGCGRMRLPRRSRASACRCPRSETAGTARSSARRIGRPARPLVICDESGAGAPIAEAAAGLAAGRRRRCSSGRRAASPKRSLTSRQTPLCYPRRARAEGAARRDRRTCGPGGLPGDRRRLAPHPCRVDRARRFAA